MAWSLRAREIASTPGRAARLPRRGLRPPGDRAIDPGTDGTRETETGMAGGGGSFMRDGRTERAPSPDRRRLDAAGYRENFIRVGDRKYHHAPTRTRWGPTVGLRFGTRLVGLRVRAGTARPALRCLRSGPCRCTCLSCSARAASSSASFWRWALMASPWCRMAARWLSMSLSATSSTNSCMSSVPEPSTSFERKRRT